LEEEISDLEDELMLFKKIDLIDIMTFRKKLLSLKLYYQQLLEVYEGIEQNENALIDLKEERNFRILSGRANRLYDGVLNLRDYVTQVREAYQTQIDINLNSIMKVFTVITSFFFPLTLIVGWYGMNLKMPEFGWRYGYLFVIGISILTAVTTLLYFKRKKWL
jgi:magnesium transporter